MNIELSYNEEFDNLMSELHKKYPSKLFDVDGIGEQLDLNKFSRNFFTTNNTSDVSVDANANVDDISVIAYSTELPKPYLKLNSYYMLWKELKKNYSLEIANEIIEKQINGTLYINDAHGIGGSLSYCFNYSTYDIMLLGLPMIKKIKSIPPKYLYSFKSQLEQFTIIAANSTLGATGLADMLLVMSYYVKNALNSLSDANFHFKDIDSVWKYVEENIVSFIYTINQPLRGNQSCFTNISIYDDNFLNSLKDDYIFLDGTTLDVELVKKIQDLFLTIMNDEMKRTPITFPITTACFSVDQNNNIQDKSFLKFIAKHNKEFGFINIYCGASSTLSSCCFDGQQKATIKINKNDIQITESFKILYEKYALTNIKTLYRNNWVDCKLVKINKNNKKLFKIELSNNGDSLLLTEDHINLTSIGEKNTIELTTEDYLLGYSENKNGDYFIKIKSIEEYHSDDEFVYCFEMKNQDEPYFTLPNGIITHNCRLRSDTNNEYFNSFGAGSSKIGSLSVVTINLPRLAFKYKNNEQEFYLELKHLVNLCAKINNVRRKLVQKRIDNGNHPLYTYGFINIKKQYSTVGINGFNECIEILGKDILNDDGTQLGLKIIEVINQENTKCSNILKTPHNCEQIPAETVSVKLAAKDKLLKYQNTYNIYSNQFIPLTTKANILDRIRLQGIFDKHFSGGAIAHINVDTQIENEKQIEDLIETCAKQGVIYFAINYVLSKCINGHMSVTNGNTCSICGEKITDKYTRVVGFLVNVKNFNKTRREEDFPNRQFYKGGDI